MAEDSSTFAEMLRRYRRDVGLTQEELAERADISVRGIAGLEIGERHTPRRETVQVLANALALAGEDRVRFEAAARAPTPRGAPIARHNLPTPLSSFVGRERESEDVRRILLTPPARLVTLIGPGGVGKTRLALRVLEEVRHSFPDGVRFVDLAYLRHPKHVQGAIAYALNIHETMDRPVADALRTFLRDKRMLLLLDNFEHLLEAAPQVAELLVTCQQLKVLVTSRAPLQLTVEREYPVPPLSLPDLGSPSTPTALVDYEAKRLFVERARSIQPNFVVDDSNAEIIGQICRRLDGLPLAIELAAPLVRIFPPDNLLARLGHSLRLLRGGARDLPERQQTLRATLDWSYKLLPEADQELFATLAVFKGGCTVEAAEFVCSPRQDIDIVQRLRSLAERSLITQVSNHSWSRLIMLETVHEYADELLLHSEDNSAIRQRHAEYFLLLAERSEPEVRGSAQEQALERLGAERGNLLAALSWFVDEGRGENALRLATALGRFWLIRGPFSEGHHWLEAALALDQDSSPDLRIRTLNELGRIACEQGDLDRAATWLYESLSLSGRASDPLCRASASTTLGTVLLRQGDYAHSSRLFEDSLELSHAAGDDSQLAAALNGLGWVALLQGSFGPARDLFERSLSLRRDVGSLWSVAAPLDSLAFEAFHRGEHERADHLAAEALRLFGKVGDRRGASECLDQLASISLVGGELHRAARLRGAAHAMRKSIGAARPVLMPVDYDEYQARVQTEAGGGDIALAWADGEAMDLETAVAYALGKIEVI